MAIKTKKTFGNKAHNKGFSLLEIIICIGLFSLLLIALSHSIEKINSAIVQTTDNHKSAQQLNRAMAIIVNDIRSIGKLGCLKNQGTIIDNDHFFSPLDANSTEEKKPLSLLSISKIDGLNSLSIIHTNTITTLKNYIDNFKQLTIAANKNKTKLLHFHNCETAVTINTSNMTVNNKKIIAEHPVFILEKTQYQSQIKNGIKVLYRRQLSSNNKLYSRPLLTDIHNFDIQVITHSGIYDSEKQPKGEMVIAIYVSLSVINSSHKEINISRLITLINNKTIFYISPKR